MGPAPTRSESKSEENDEEEDEVVGESREAWGSGEVVGIGGGEKSSTVVSPPNTP
jgi:hypothetical protein